MHTRISDTKQAQKQSLEFVVPHKLLHPSLLVICFGIVRPKVARACFLGFCVFCRSDEAQIWKHKKLNKHRTSHKIPLPCFLLIRRTDLGKARNRFWSFHKTEITRHWRRSNWFQIVRWWDFNRLSMMIHDATHSLLTLDFVYISVYMPMFLVINILLSNSMFS